MVLICINGKIAKKKQTKNISSAAIVTRIRKNKNGTHIKTAIKPPTKIDQGNNVLEDRISISNSM